MIVKRFFEPLIAQNSYLVACGDSHEAIVIDPNVNAQQYIDAAAAQHLRITHVTETHIHADFLSGARELAQRTGASLCLSDEGDASWKYQFPHDRKLKNGDRITIGNVSVDVLHTPGHTPEHITFLITDGAVADQPIAAVTGDFVFVGDVGRPDLLEKAAKIAGTMESSARTLWKSLQLWKPYPDWLQLWPGHGAGSACGKGISAVPHSTLGYERLFNWAFNAKSEDEFVKKVLTGQPDPPPYFAIMKRLNKTTQTAPAAAGKASPTLEEVLAAGHLVVDTRPAEVFAQGHRHGALNIPLGGSFVTWAGWLIPYDRDFYVITDRLDEVKRALALIGLDRVAGHFSEFAGRGGEEVRQISVNDLKAQQPSNGLVVIDVRYDNEWNEGHIPNALHIPLGQLAQRINEVPANENVVVHCQGGGRSAIAASLLQKLGRKNVANLTGGYKAYKAT
ncbi:MAG: MBL fold metallo-hydrolase [Cyanobacteria bacterium]|nr:MBL fold metallo-hydrolase [Cyanobacteriota bacterium]